MVGITDHTLVPVAEAAQMLGVSKMTVYRLIKKRAVVSVKLEGQRGWLVSVESMEEYHAAKSMSVRELSVMVLQLQREVQEMRRELNKKDVDNARAPVGQGNYIDPHDAMQILRKKSPQFFED